jgi:hypothetical protein
VLRIVATAPAKPAVGVEYRPERRIRLRPATFARRRASQGQRGTEAFRKRCSARGPKEIVRLGRGELVEGTHGIRDLSLHMVSVRVIDSLTQHDLLLA